MMLDVSTATLIWYYIGGVFVYILMGLAYAMLYEEFNEKTLGCRVCLVAVFLWPLGLLFLGSMIVFAFLIGLLKGDWS